MTCTGVGLARFCKWEINRPDPVMSTVRCQPLALPAALPVVAR